MTIYFRLIIMILIFGTMLSCVSNKANEIILSTESAEKVENAKGDFSISPVVVGKPEFDADTWFSERVEDRNLVTALVATLKPGKNFAEYNTEKVFNPASLIKLATTLVALKKLGAKHRFIIKVYANGEVDNKGTLNGDLYFSGSDPTFNGISANFIAKELQDRGVLQITGKIYVSPDFTFNYNDTAERSAELLAGNLHLKKKPEFAVSDKPSGTELFNFKSFTLQEVLLYMNTYSINFIAHQLGNEVGGVQAVRQFLIDELKLNPAKVKLETTSGLEENNGMTAQDIFLVMRALTEELKQQGLQPVDVLPTAGETVGTLRMRLAETNFKQAATGKTGTLSAADGGIGMASFAGLIYTKNYGIVGFVMMHEGASHALNKKLQDEFLKDVLECRIDPQPFNFESKRIRLPKSEMQIEGKNEITSKAKFQ